LTAKVFRTFNASNLFQIELNKIEKKYEKYEEKDRN
jgi:DNA topoisomerase-1